MLRSRAIRVLRPSAVLRPSSWPVRFQVGRALSAAAAQPPITGAKVLFGSQTGTAQGFAMQLAGHLEELGPVGISAVSCEDLYEYGQEPSMSKLQAEQAVVFVVSCFGRGEPTDSAKAFMKWIADPAREAEGGLAGLRYAVFGLGSSQTHKAYYNVVGKALDARLESLGATRLFPRGEGDASGPSIELDFEAWEQKLLAQLQGQGQAGEGQGKGTGAATSDATAAAPSSGPAAITASGRPLVLPLKSLNPYHSEADCPVTIIPAAAPCDLPCGKDGKPVAAPQPSLGRSLLVPEGFHPLAVRSMVNLTPQEGLRPIYELRLGTAGSNSRSTSGLVPAGTVGSVLPTYTTGDHVAVQPTNSRQAVDRLCRRLRWDPDFQFSLAGSATAASATGTAGGANAAPGPKLPFSGVVTVAQALSHYCAIGAAVSPQMLRTLAAHASEGRDRDSLLALTDRDSFITNVRDQYLQLADVLEAHPSVSLPLDRYISLAPPLMPRYYSISSSPALHPGEMHVTYRHLRVGRKANNSASAIATGPNFEGSCSTYMSNLRVGDAVPVGVRPSSFRLPVDPTLPVVMIAGGIGVAPFRAFLEDRLAGAAAGKAYGPSVLLYGCRDSHDEVYRGLAQQAYGTASASGLPALSSFEIAHAAPLPGSPSGYSSTGPVSGGPIFADALVKKHGQAVWECLQKGGIVYVCGGASGFGSAVAAAVKAVVAERLPVASSSASARAEAAEAYMNALLAENRFLEDLAD